MTTIKVEIDFEGSVEDILESEVAEWLAEMYVTCKFEGIPLRIWLGDNRLDAETPPLGKEPS